jgi:hypothetical protein
LCDEYPCKLINSVFHKSEKLKDRVNNVCTLEEKDTLYKAFFFKEGIFRSNLSKTPKKVEVIKTTTKYWVNKGQLIRFASKLAYYTGCYPF